MCVTCCRSFVLRPESVAWSKVEPAASAVMSQAYLAAILPALKASTSSSPRMHTLWSYLLPYLLPGFRPNKVGGGGESCRGSGRVHVPHAAGGQGSSRISWAQRGQAQRGHALCALDGLLDG